MKLFTQDQIDKEKERLSKITLSKDIYEKDEWDNETFTWEEQHVKSGYQRPVIIHRAILGSVERLIAVLTEHTGGKWPFWISPRQVIVCTVGDKFNDYAKKVHDTLVLAGYHCELDISNSTVKKKVRDGQLGQFNYIAVCGEEEVKGNCVDLRSREDKRIGKKTIPELIELFKSLEPVHSNVYNQLVANSINQNTSSLNQELAGLDEKLKFVLFFGGESPNDEDKTLFEKLKEANIPKESYANLYKWRMLYLKHFNK